MHDVLHVFWHACSAVDITEQYLKQLEAAEPQVRSFITVAAESARTSARQLDERIAKEGTSNLGPLAGVPLGIKVVASSSTLLSNVPCSHLHFHDVARPGVVLTICMCLHMQPAVHVSMCY